MPVAEVGICSGVAVVIVLVGVVVNAVGDARAKVIAIDLEPNEAGPWGGTPETEGVVAVAVSLDGSLRFEDVAAGPHVSEVFVAVTGIVFRGLGEILQVADKLAAVDGDLEVRADVVLGAGAGEAAQGRDVIGVEPIEVVIGVIGHAGEAAFGIVLRIHETAEADLLEVVQAGDPARLFLRLGEGRHEHPCQDGNDRDDHQKLYQGKTGAS